MIFFARKKKRVAVVGREAAGEVVRQVQGGKEVGKEVRRWS